MLEIRGLKVKGLDAVSFEIAPGECVSVRGPSGSGKSLLLRAIADLDPAEGEILLDGRSRMHMSGPEWRRLIRYAAAEPGWWADTVKEHFADAGYAARAAHALGLPEAIVSRPVARLSTGERQRLALARALEDGPQVLLLDEPTGALDGDARAQVETLIEEQLKKGVYVIMVTHDAGQAERLADKRLAIRDGRLGEEEAP